MHQSGGFIFAYLKVEALQLQRAAEIQQDVSERIKEAVEKRGVRRIGWRECDEMMNVLAVGTLVTSSSESTSPPNGEKEFCEHIKLMVMSLFYPLC